MIQNGDINHFPVGAIYYVYIGSFISDTKIDAVTYDEGAPATLGQGFQLRRKST